MGAKAFSAHQPGGKMAQAIWPAGGSNPLPGTREKSLIWSRSSDGIARGKGEMVANKVSACMPLGRRFEPSRDLYKGENNE